LTIVRGIGRPEIFTEFSRQTNFEANVLLSDTGTQTGKSWPAEYRLWEICPNWLLLIAKRALIFVEANDS